MKTTDAENWILSYLQCRDFTTPTSIGFRHAEAFGYNINTHHSSWASPICLRLVKKGLLVPNDKGHYKLK